MATKQRYYIQSQQIREHTIKIEGEDVHHIKNVMRMKIHDTVFCFDEQGIVYESEIVAITDHILLAIKKQGQEHTELSKNITIAQGLVRREKVEEVIKRLVELGCKEYIPVQMNRSIVKPIKDKTMRWETIIKEASEQSHRTSMMKVQQPISWQDFFTYARNYDCCLFAHLGEETPHLKTYLSTCKQDKVLIVVGPEGGFDQSEVINLKKHGFLPVGLGNRILRTETAPLFIMSACSYELGE